MCVNDENASARGGMIPYAREEGGLNRGEIFFLSSRAFCRAGVNRACPARGVALGQLAPLRGLAKEEQEKEKWTAAGCCVDVRPAVREFFDRSRLTPTYIEVALGV